MRSILRSIDRLLARVRGRTTVPSNAEVDDELRFHLEMEEALLARSGATLDDARHEAHRRFGGVDRYAEEVRDVRGARWIEWLAADVRHGVRLAWRSPLHTVIVLLTLGFAIGANSAIFSVVDAALLRPLPFPRPDELVALYAVNPDRSFPRFSISYADFVDWQRDTRSFAGMAAVGSTILTLDGDDNQDPERLSGIAVTGDFFSVLGARAGIGRLFGPDDASGGSSDAVVLTAPLWRRRFAGDSAIVGRTIPFSGRSRTVIGILSDDFRFGQGLDFVVVLSASGLPDAQNHGQHNLGGFGRLKPGVTLAAAQQDLEAVAARLAEVHPEIRGWSTNVFRLSDEATRNVKQPLLILLAAAGLVLLIGCMNVTNLQMTRNAARNREVALRQALGASRSRVGLQLLVESAVLAIAGGALGMGIGAAGTRLLLLVVPRELIPGATDIALDGRVIAFTMGLSFVTAVLVGLWPALRVSRSWIGGALQEGRRSQAGAETSTRFRRTLVVAESALALTLLVCAGLVLQSLRHILDVNPGFQVDHTVTTRLTLGPAAYPESAAVAFYRELTRRLTGRAGIDAVAAANTPPLSAGGLLPSVRILGKPGAAEPVNVATTAVTPGYFRTAGIRLLSGRDFAWEDRQLALIVSETFARTYWPGENVLGKRVAMSQRDTIGLEIIGMVADSRARGLTQEPMPMMYMPFRGALNVARAMTVLVRGRSDVTTMVSATRAVVKELDPRLPVYNVRTLREIVDRSIAQPRLNATLLTVFAVMALLLSAIGIYGVIAYLVAQRTRELGVRIALGAQRGDVLRLVLGEGALLAGLGGLLGVIGSIGATRLIRTWLFGIGTLDVATFAAAAALLLSIALLASYVPARRATRVDPLQAIRAD